MRLSKEEMGKKIQDLWYSMRRAIVVEALFLNKILYFGISLLCPDNKDMRQ